MIELKGSDKDIIQALKEFASKWHKDRKKESAIITNEQLFKLLSVVCMEQYARDKLQFEKELNKIFVDVEQRLNIVPGKDNKGDA